MRRDRLRRPVRRLRQATRTTARPRPTRSKNCARCGLTCSDADVANARASCERGFCGVGQCYMGFGDCNETPGDGCEQTLTTNQHCGACNTPCEFTGSDDDCGTGVCFAQACTAATTTATATRRTAANRSTPARTAAAAVRPATARSATSPARSAMRRRASCTAPRCTRDCDTDPGTGCETPINTRDRCGACDKPCAINNAEVSCETGSCEFVRCNEGWGDCNDDLSPADGCETPLDTLQQLQRAAARRATRRAAPAACAPRPTARAAARRRLRRERTLRQLRRQRRRLRGRTSTAT